MKQSLSLTAPPALWKAIQSDLLSTPDLERAAVGFAGVNDAGGATRLLLRDWAPVSVDEYLVQLGNHLEVSPVFWARAAKRARATNESLVIMHSHPRDAGSPRFSHSDDAGERLLVPGLRARAGVPVAAVVVSPGGATARHADGGTATPIELSIVGGPSVRVANMFKGDAFDRQVRALGKEGQMLLRSLTVGVVGAGGLGSHVIQQLVHLGVGRVIVIDPDRVADTNLSRLVGASRLDVWLHRKKTRVAQRLSRRLHRLTEVVPVSRSVMEPAVGRRLLDCDVVIGCTDNQFSRVVLNTLAFQYYIPVMDLGVELQISGAMGGRVAWLAPGHACLWCMGILDSERVRIEQLPQATRDEEVARGYIQGVEEPAPAVVSINGVVASLGVTEVLARFTGFAGTEPRGSLLMYRLRDGVVRRTTPSAVADCPTCSCSGLLGMGDLASSPWPGALG